MSNTQPAGGRVVRNLLTSLSPSSQTMFANTHFPSPVAQENPLPVAPPSADQEMSVDTFAATALPREPETPPAPRGEIESEPETPPAPEPAEELETAPPIEQTLAADSPEVPPQSETLSLSEDPTILPEFTAPPPSNPPPLSTPPSLTTPPPATPPQPAELTDSTKLALFDEVLQEVEQERQQPHTSGRQKEVLEGGTLQTPVATQELPAGVQYAEQEHAAEIPPEVESYIQEVQDAAAVQPKEIVIAEAAPPATAPNPTAPPRVVRVIPLTKEQAAVGMRKNPTFSIRWLVEFGNKLAKMFIGQVVYKN